MFFGRYRPDDRASRPIPPNSRHAPWQCAFTFSNGRVAGAQKWTIGTKRSSRRSWRLRRRWKRRPSAGLHRRRRRRRRRQRLMRQMRQSRCRTGSPSRTGTRCRGPALRCRQLLAVVRQDALHLPRRHLECRIRLAGPALYRAVHYAPRAARQSLRQVGALD